VKHYLIVFDRLSGEVIQEAVYSDRREALRERFNAERRHQGREGIEVVVLAATSPAVLRRTHARYFKPVSGLLQGVLGEASNLSQPNPGSAPC
jgi:hypothetical protein